jgi:hypothetical protein
MNNERMTLPKFLKEVDTLSKNLSHENMKMISHEIARTWPENRRNNLLQLIKSYKNISESESCHKYIDDGISQTILNIESIRPANNSSPFRQELLDRKNRSPALKMSITTEPPS